MGVNKRDIRTVIHTEISPSIESYVQETGRSGRDGKPATAILLYSYDDLLRRTAMDDLIARDRYDRMIRYALSMHRCRRETLLTGLGYEYEYCGGCDCCDKNTVIDPEGRHFLCGFVRKHRRTYSIREASFLLAGKNDDDWSTYFGSLSMWNPNDIDEALRVLVKSDLLSVPSRGWWPNKLTTGKKDKTWMDSLQRILMPE